VLVGIGRGFYEGELCWITVSYSTCARYGNGIQLLLLIYTAVYLAPCIYARRPIATPSAPALGVGSRSLCSPPLYKPHFRSRGSGVCLSVLDYSVYNIAVDRKSIALAILQCYVQSIYARRPIATLALVSGFAPSGAEPIPMPSCTEAHLS
jgi:hypothetical protein